MRISDWSSDVRSSDLAQGLDCRSGLLSAKVIGYSIEAVAEGARGVGGAVPFAFGAQPMKEGFIFLPIRSVQSLSHRAQLPAYERAGPAHPRHPASNRSEEHTTALPSLMLSSYALFRLKTKKTTKK